MTKYWVVFKNSFQSSMVHRFDFFGVFVAEIFTLAAMTYLWLSIYRQGDQVGGYSLRGLIIYYLLAKFIGIAIGSWNVAWVVGDQIREGGITNFLTKPISFLGKTFFASLGSIIYRMIIYFFLFLLLLVSGIGDFSLEPKIFFCFLIFIFLGILINFFIFYFIGISTFYFGFIMGFSFIMQNVSSFFSGNLMPIDIFPSALARLAEILPFKFLVFVPISVVTGKISGAEIGRLFLEGSLWATLLYFTAVIFYKKGIKRNESFGG